MSYNLKVKRSIYASRESTHSLGPIIGGPDTATSQSSPPLSSEVFAFCENRTKNSTREESIEDREVAVSRSSKMGSGMLHTMELDITSLSKN
jgi:hypothetical protein